MEFIIGLITGYIITWPVLAMSLLLIIVAEHNDESKFALFWAIVAASISYFYFNLAIADIAWYIGTYVVIGVGWSVWRYMRYVKNYIAEEIQTKSAHTSVEAIKERVMCRCSVSNMAGRVVSWIIIWPFSMIENLTKDIYDTLIAVVKNVLRKVYDTILTNMVRGITDESVNRNK